MSENSQGRVAWDVAFGQFPTKGSRALPQLLDFTQESPVNVNLSYEQESLRLEFVQTLYIDNSSNANDLTMTMRATGQAMIVLAGWQGYLPVLATADNCHISFSTSGTPKIPVQFLSFPMPAILWPSTATANTVTTIANTSGGASVYSAYGSPGNAGLTSTPVAVKTSGGNLYGINLYNPNGAIVFVSLYNVVAGSVTVGTTPAAMVIAVPANGWWEEKFTGEGKITFSTAITAAAATGVNNNTAPVSAILANIMYK